MTPKIDYILLADAITFYQRKGYKYVEVPWIVSKDAIRATLPEEYDFMQIGIEDNDLGDLGPAADGLLQPYYGCENALVGSAEQGFITMSLPPGKYVGVTPCFRCEERQDIFTRDTFMKVELFDNRPAAKGNDALKVAMTFFRQLVDDAALREVETSDGVDIYLGDVEIGSYGAREDSHAGRWVYGTGLALPRFSVANAIVQIG